MAAVSNILILFLTLNVLSISSDCNEWLYYCSFFDKNLMQSHKISKKYLKKRYTKQREHNKNHKKIRQNHGQKRKDGEKNQQQYTKHYTKNYINMCSGRVSRSCVWKTKLWWWVAFVGVIIKLKRTGLWLRHLENIHCHLWHK